MKKLYLFTTRLAAFWVLFPLSILLVLAIKHTSDTDGLLGLYPLIILTSAAIIFSIIYFFRAIKISYSEIKYIGFFSSKDSAIINEGKKLILEREGGGRVKIILFGNDGVLPELDWMKKSETAPTDIVLFRGHARYGSFTVKRILKFFGADKESISHLLLDEYECECEFTTMKSARSDKVHTVEITVNETV